MDQLLSIREKHKELVRQGQIVNHRKIQRLMKELRICVTSFMHKSHKYNSYKGKAGHIDSNKANRRFTTLFLIKRLLRI